MTNKQLIYDCWQAFKQKHNVSVDRMVCDPQLRESFLADIKTTCPVTSEREALWTLMGMRKQKGVLTKS